MATRLSKDGRRVSLRSASSSASASVAAKPTTRKAAAAAASAAAADGVAMSVDTSVAQQADAAPDADATSGHARMLTPPPSSARTELAKRIGDVSLHSPLAAAPAEGTDNRLLAELLTSGSFSAQNRAILLSGLPQSQPAPAPAPAHEPSSPAAQRGPGAPLRRCLTPLVTANSTASPHQHHHHHQQQPPLPTSQLLLSAIGGAPSPGLPSPHTISPCVYVRATSLRRRSSGSSGSNSSSGAASPAQAVAGEKVSGDEGAKRDARRTAAKAGSRAGSKAAPPAARPSDAKLTTPPPEGRLVVSAHIVPADPAKAPFALRREFDLAALLAALPRPDRRRPSSVFLLPSPLVRSPLSALPGGRNNSSSGSGSSKTAPAPTPASTPVAGVRSTATAAAAGTKRPASDHTPHTPASPHPSLRRHSQAQRSRQLSQKDALPLPSPNLPPGDGIPIATRPHPSLGGFPGLAAIILSGRVGPGDTIELPLPHPEVWPLTVSYIYDGHGELTEEIRRNIVHLGGQCD